MDSANTDDIGMKNAVKESAKIVLAKIMIDIDYSLRQQDNNNMLLKSFTKEMDNILLILLDSEKIRHQTAARIAIFIGKQFKNFKFRHYNLKTLLFSGFKHLYIFSTFRLLLGHNNPCMLTTSCKFLFQNAKNEDQLALLVRILTNELLDKSLQPYCDKGGYFSVVLEDILAKNFQDNMMDDGATEECVDMPQLWSNLLTLLMYVSTLLIR